MPKIKKKTPNIQLLLEENNKFIKQYHSNKLMQLITSSKMSDKSIRTKMLDGIQTFSDYFQRVTMLRYVLCDNQRFLPVAEQHLNEEFGHNQSLMQDRKNKPAAWDPILDATASWFAWKMFTLDNEEKTVLMHLVLEASANIFFREAHKVMKMHSDTNYFEIHSELDEHHENMGKQLLEDLTPQKYTQLLKVQRQGWEVLNVICNQIADLTG